MIIEKIKRIWKPEVFHGYKKGQFEGWYFKIVDKNSKHIWAFITGISMTKRKDETLENQSHAFIQIYNGVSGEYHYIKYNLSDFEASTDNFLVKIKKNKFSKEKIQLNINQGNLRILGELKFQDTVPWPVKLLNPGTMGPFAFVPKMECYHGVLSFDHVIKGSLLINGDEIDFTEGRGFISKEWGISHPSSWIWIQSNHFENAPGTSLNVSIARIPYLNQEFPGFIIGFVNQGKLYRFTTYNRSKLEELQITEDQVSFKVSNKNYLMRVNAVKKGGTELRSPITGIMSGNVIESLTSTVEIHLFKKRSNKEPRELIFHGTGEPTGLEIKGNSNELVSQR